jgi:hypothetical protein
MSNDNQQKTNSGAIFRNERKQQPNHPDYQGACEIGTPPVSYWISMWCKEAGPQSKNPGQRFFSLAFTPKDAPRAAVAPRDDDMAPTPVAGAPKQETPPIPYRETKPAAPLSQVEKELDSADAPF